MELLETTGLTAYVSKNNFNFRKCRMIDLVSVAHPAEMLSTAIQFSQT